MYVQEDYVSFETAKLLKGKGFDGECRDYYDTYEDFYSEDFKSDWNHGGKAITIFSAPTLQMAMKWLRKKHNIHIEPRYFPMPNIYRYVIIHSPFTIENIDSHPQYFNTHEEACEAAIKYCLKNLII